MRPQHPALTWRSQAAHSQAPKFLEWVEGISYRSAKADPRGVYDKIFAGQGGRGAAEPGAGHSLLPQIE